jgi:hypothetical protein
MSLSKLLSSEVRHVCMGDVSESQAASS